jgi:glutamate---cysteine ligase / carboxylate-amine ligase
MLDGQFTLGVEEEYQIVHPETRELRSYVSHLVESGRNVLAERVRPEMHQSMVEVGTSICQDVAQVRRELTELRRELNALAERGGLRIVAASSHPFSDWKKQDITDGERYSGLVEDLQDVARANLVFGLHVHVGIKDRQDAMILANQVRYFLPHLLALTTSSPFWLGRKTGLASIRSEVFKRFPRTGIPDEFPTYQAYIDFVDALVTTGCIDNAKKIWWDVRVHPFFETVELRVCDMPTNIDHVVAITALVQALMAKLYILRKSNLAWRTYSRMLIEENKWRAIRYGIHGKMLDFGKMTQVPTKDLIRELIEFVSDAADLLGTRAEVERVDRILVEGTSADRQLQAFEESGGDLNAVVDWLIAESMKNTHDRPSVAPRLRRHRRRARDRIDSRVVRDGAGDWLRAGRHPARFSRPRRRRGAGRQQHDAASRPALRAGGPRRLVVSEVSLRSEN